MKSRELLNRVMKELGEIEGSRDGREIIRTHAMVAIAAALVEISEALNKDQS